jgi:hypothetical protein
MRKALGLFCAAALMLPLGVVTANPATGAAKTPTCGVAKGTATFKPPLPKETNKTVKAKLGAKGSISKCVGGGVKSGSITFTQTSKPEAGNCQTLAEVKPGDKPTVGKLVIKWNNGKTSTAGKFTIKQTKSVVDAGTTGKITAGLFKGKTIKGTTTYKLPTGACSTKNLAKLTYTNKKGTKFVIK